MLCTSSLNIHSVPPNVRAGAAKLVTMAQAMIRSDMRRMHACKDSTSGSLWPRPSRLGPLDSEAVKNVVRNTAVSRDRRTMDTSASPGEIL
jgi:hypothetical protein